MVLGAGIQGVCVALALQHHGYRVTLVDQSPEPMLRASLRNEGKIHLGFVYANDAELLTPLLMLRAALRFAPLLDEWTGQRLDWQGLTSVPFTYVVARDSMLPADRIFARYADLQDAYREQIREEPVHYLGGRPRRLWNNGSPGEVVRVLQPGYAQGIAHTVEAALDLRRFRAILVRQLDSTEWIQVLCGHRVESIVRTAAGFRIEGRNSVGETWELEAGRVVNCLWDERMRLDAQLGIQSPRPWVYRLKYRLLGELPPDLSNLPSLTFVLGPYGDVVVNPGCPTYISWYPVCMRGWSNEIVPPASWEAACAGRVDVAAGQQIAGEALEAFDAVIPGVRRSRIDVVDGGVIFSWGESDIDDPCSELHERHDIGVQSHDGYYSIDTGKFTCAPYFAQKLVEQFA